MVRVGWGREVEMGRLGDVGVSFATGEGDRSGMSVLIRDGPLEEGISIGNV